MHITLRYPRDAIKYMLNEETEMQRVRDTIENELRDFKKEKRMVDKTYIILTSQRLI
ncbi:MAG: hypothetical protein MPEBLZ_01383 [Candidatus Methanoperedens nitroreducens]|uniref:Uncharacterized protein n=1 Tax=Candidatus Methanoperedens nitratireducens TaxID=1392998 RepID=A0A0P8A7G7_9EURY|nr:MAG: hypothetical protein MPEBLZ_01383 [Candidatus Methanoperedens sp. BLZ1]